MVDGVRTRPDGADDGDGLDAALSMLASLHDDGADGREGVVRPLLRLVGELSGLESVYLTHIRWADGEQEIELARNTADDFAVSEGLVVPWHETLCELSLASGAGWNVDVQGTWGDRPAATDLGIASYVSVPVQLAGDQRPYGTLCGASPRTVEADERVVEVLRLIAPMVAAALERDRALARAQARADDAEARLEGRIAFAAQVEHALRTPLTVMSGWVRMLQGRPDDAQLRERGLEQLLDATQRLAAQVGDLLSEARSAIGIGPPEDVDVGALARGLDELTGDRPYDVVGDLELHADPIAVAVLVEHLVENAVTHTPSGTPIRVLLGPGSLVVEDDGPGLPDRDDLLEPFVSADDEARGTGLGLHIVAQIAERLGATIELGASASGGARFALAFPG